MIGSDPPQDGLRQPLVVNQDQDEGEMPPGNQQPPDQNNNSNQNQSMRRIGLPLQGNKYIC